MTCGYFNFEKKDITTEKTNRLLYSLDKIIKYHRDKLIEKAIDQTSQSEEQT